MLNLNFKYIDPRLVLEFVPESPENPQATPENPTPLHDFLTVRLQTYDCAQAFHYVEKEMIPFLQAQNSQGFKDVKPKLIIKWIKEIHQIAAKTVAEDQGFVAGEYSQATTLRWQKSVRMHDALAQHLKTDPDFTPVFAAFELEEYAQPFMALLARVRGDSSIEEIEAKRPYHQQQNEIVRQRLNLTEEQAAQQECTKHILKFDKDRHKLVDAFHQHKLQPEELDIIKPIFKIGLAPEAIPQALNNFAVEFVGKLQKGKKEFSDIVDLCTFAFQQITTIHPFPNGNGRVATAFLVALLIAFDQPCVLLRTAQDKKNENGLYSTAVRHLDTNPRLFKDYLKRLIKKPARVSKTSEDLDIEARTLINIVNMALVFDKLKRSGSLSPEELEKKWTEKKLALIAGVKSSQLPAPRAELLPSFSQLRIASSSLKPPAADSQAKKHKKKA